MNIGRKGNWHRKVLGAFVVMAVALAVTSRARAQSGDDPANVRLCDPGPCGGFSGPTTIVTTDENPDITFYVNGGPYDSGEAYLAVLVPGTSGLTFKVNGSGPVASGTFSTGAFTDYLGTTGLLPGTASVNMSVGANSDFSAFQSAATQAGISSPTSFSVYIYDLGAYSGSALSSTTFNVSSFPAGTIFYGFLTDQKCTSGGTCAVEDATPLSEAVTEDGPGGVTPEPASLALFGSGLLLIGGFIRKRLA